MHASEKPEDDRPVGGLFLLLQLDPLVRQQIKNFGAIKEQHPVARAKLKRFEAIWAQLQRQDRVLGYGSQVEQIILNRQSVAEWIIGYVRYGERLYQEAGQYDDTATSIIRSGKLVTRLVVANVAPNQRTEIGDNVYTVTEFPFGGFGLLRLDEVEKSIVLFDYDAEISPEGQRHARVDDYIALVQDLQQGGLIH